MPTEFNAAQVSALRERLRVLSIEHFGVVAAGEFCALARPAVRLTHGDPTSATRLGGGAFLEPEQSWPSADGRMLALVVVLDLEEVARFVIDVDLPAQGYLNFFYDAEEQSAWGFEPDDFRAWRVLYASASAAVEVAPPTDAPSFPVVWLQAEQTLTLPGWEEPVATPFFPAHARRRRGLLGKRRHARDDARREAYWDLQHAWNGTDDDSPDHIGHQIGGWPVLQQAPIWRECDLVSQGYPLGNPDQWRAAQRANVPDTQADWRLLLQVESDDAAGWMWGDVGALYYAVRETDPELLKFDRAWMVLQCG